MRSLILTLLILLMSGVAWSRDQEKFEAYQQRLKERKIYARNLMRETRASRSVGIYNPFRTVYVRTPYVRMYYPYNQYVSPYTGYRSRY